jgi:phosphate transport system substrate-binding protein
MVPDLSGKREDFMLGIGRIAVLLLLATGSLSAADASAGALVRVSGTGAGFGGMKIVARAFERKNPGVTVNVLPPMGTTGGVKAVQSGRLDIALASRPLTPDEREPGLSEEPYARTAFVFGAQASNPAHGFRLSEIEEIYSGKRDRWPAGGPIRLVLRPIPDAFSIYLETFTPGMKTAVERAHAVPGKYVGATDQDAADYIEKTPGAFGTTSLALVVSERRAIKPLAVDGVLPTDANVADGKYPYAMTLSLVYRSGRAHGGTAAFIDFVFSKEGRAILSRNGCHPLARAAAKP